MRFRLLPVVIVAAVMLLSLRVGGVWERAGIELGTASIAQTLAADPAAAAALEPAAGATMVAEADDPAAPASQTPDAAASQPEPFDLDEVTPGELRVLEDLAERRRELERRERDLEFREGLLQATEQRVDEKIEELEALRAELQAVLDKKEGEEAAEIQRLVQIYSKMKPKDAARVFERLEIPLLLSVLRAMKEIRSAPILAEMDPDRVSEVTAELAREEDLAANPN